MEYWTTMLVTIFCSVVASSGFWAFMQKRSECRSLQAKMLSGLGHDRIIHLGMKYIKRGWITQGEFEDLHEYLYKPYLGLGCNGSATRIMNEVNKLPIKTIDYERMVEENEENVED